MGLDSSQGRTLAGVTGKVKVAPPEVDKPCCEAQAKQ